MNNQEEPTFIYRPRHINSRANQIVTISVHHGSPLFDWDAHFSDGVTIPIHDDEIEC